MTTGHDRVQNVFSYHRMCSLTIECVILLTQFSVSTTPMTTERVLLPQNVFSYHQMCSLTTSILLSTTPMTTGHGRVQNVFSYHRMCSLTTSILCLYRTWPSAPSSRKQPQPQIMCSVLLRCLIRNLVYQCRIKSLFQAVAPDYVLRSAPVPH
jgi:hypothetical protein